MAEEPTLADEETPSTPVAAEPSTEETPSAPSLTLVPDAVEPEAPETPSEDESPTEADLAHQEFLRERGLEGEAPSAPDASAPTPLDPAIEEAATRIANERQAAAQVTQATQQQAQAYQQTTDAVYNFLLQKGLSYEDALMVRNTFTAWDSAARSIHSTEATRSENLRTVQTFYDEMAKAVSKADGDKFLSARGVEHKSPTDTIKAFQELSRKGYVSERDVKTREAKAVTDYKSYLESKGLIVGGKAPKAAEGQGSGTGRETLSQWAARSTDSRKEVLARDPEYADKLRAG